MKIKSGIKLLEEIQGSGLIAERGDNLTYNVRAFLSKGDEINFNKIPEADRAKHPPEIFNMQDGYEFINFRATLGKRDAFAGIEYSLYGMREGGYRKVKVAPHLAFREGGDNVPAKAVVTFHIWLRKVSKKAQPTNSPYSSPAAGSKR